MISGGSGGWFGFGDNDAGAGEVDGDEVVDMTSVIVPDLSPATASCSSRLRSGSQCVWFSPIHTRQQATRYSKLCVRSIICWCRGSRMQMSRRRHRKNRGYMATLIAPEGGANRVVAGAKRRKINMRPLQRALWWGLVKEEASQ